MHKKVVGRNSVFSLRKPIPCRMLTFEYALQETCCCTKLKPKFTHTSSQFLCEITFKNHISLIKNEKTKTFKIWL